MGRVMIANPEYQNVIQKLLNAGFNVLGMDHSGNLIIEEPNCLVRIFETFLDYAWIIIVFITGMLLFGWAIAKISGSDTKIEKNLVNLTIIFGILSAVKPIINMIYGADLFGRGCGKISVPIQEVTKQYKDKLSDKNLYENIDIYIDNYNTMTPEDINWEELQPVHIPDFVTNEELLHENTASNLQ